MRKLLEAGIFYTGGQILPEIGRSNTLAHLTALEHLNNLRKGDGESLLCAAIWLRILFEESVESTLLKDPGHLFTVAQTLDHSICIAGKTHIDETSMCHICKGYAKLAPSISPRLAIMPFQTHYNNPVLDTIHNYFPAILYEPELFQTVPDIFTYTRTQMQLHFDLFSSARARYQSTRPPVAPINLAANLINALRPQTRAPINLETTLINALRPRNVTTLAPISMNIQDLITEMMVPVNPRVFEDVVVRPTAQQITQATSLESVINADEVCAICQDSIAVESEARVINACDHMFHTNCIDTWFQQNVRCPVCRHDIREVENAT
jgi:hypothetical protein